MLSYEERMSATGLLLRSNKNVVPEAFVVAGRHLPLIHMSTSTGRSSTWKRYAFSAGTSVVRPSSGRSHCRRVNPLGATDAVPARIVAGCAHRYRPPIAALAD